MELPSIDTTLFPTTTLEELDMTIQFHNQQTRQQPKIIAGDSRLTAFLRTSKQTNSDLSRSNHTTSTLGSTESCSPPANNNNNNNNVAELDELDLDLDDDLDLDLNSLGDVGDEEYEAMLNDTDFSKVRNDLSAGLGGGHGSTTSFHSQQSIPEAKPSEAMDRLNEAFGNLTAQSSSAGGGQNKLFAHLTAPMHHQTQQLFLRPSAQQQNTLNGAGAQEPNLLRVFQRTGSQRSLNHNRVIKSNSQLSLKLGGGAPRKETFVKARSLAYMGPKSAMLARNGSNTSLSSMGNASFSKPSKAAKAKASMQLRGLLMKDFKRQDSNKSLGGIKKSGMIQQRSSLEPKFQSSGMAVSAVGRF